MTSHITRAPAMPGRRRLALGSCRAVLGPVREDLRFAAGVLLDTVRGR